MSDELQSRLEETGFALDSTIRRAITSPVVTGNVSRRGDKYA